MAKLYFYYAAMNAGKSTTLLQADFNYRERGMETMLWTAAHDDRSGSGKIVSRLGIETEAHGFSPDINLFDAVVRELIRRKLDCILVDEAQFLTADHVLQLCRVADQLKIPVLCYGLRTDFLGALFPGSALRPHSHTAFNSTSASASASSEADPGNSAPRKSVRSP